MRKSWLMKFSLLSVSLVLTSNTAIASALPLMLGFYKNVSQSTVELSMTIPQATVVIFIALSSFVAKKIGQKKTVFIGLVLALISGIIPVFTSNFAIVMLSRIGLGAGFGLFNSLAVSMITEFFSGDEAATLIGFQSAFQGLGSAVMTFAAGKLLNFGWQKAFWVYLIILPIIFLFMSFVPEPNVKDSAEKNISETKTASKEKLKSSTIGYGILLLFLCVIYMVVPVKLSLFMTTSGLGSASDSGTLISFMQIANMITGFLFGWFFSKVKKFTLPVSFLIMALAFFLLFTAQNLTMVGIGAALNGISFALFVPYIFNDANRLVSQSAKASTTSFILVLANIGNFISPYGQKILEYGGSNNTLKNIFFNSSILMLILGIVFLVLTLRGKKTEDDQIIEGS